MFSEFFVLEGTFVRKPTKLTFHLTITYQKMINTSLTIKITTQLLFIL